MISSAPHRLDPLLRPRSIAVVGASAREGSAGFRTINNLLVGGFPGTLFAINSRYKSVLGVPCFPDFASLPEKVEHAILTVGDANIESALDQAIAHGIRAATMLSSLVLDEDETPVLRERITKKIHDAGLLVCGANGMGFCNFTDRVWAYGFNTRKHADLGNITMISHSGSGLCGIMDVDARLKFNLAVSPGQELSVTMADYLDFALEQSETRVVGLFMETIRDPQAMIAAFQKAHDKRIPIVAIKTGRTEMAAQLAVSHSGAIAGRDASYDALFDRYGVQRVRDMDELATALVMFAQPNPIASGGLVSIHDSGGERQLLLDLCSDLDVPLTTLSRSTTMRLEQKLDPGLPAVNPLDAWSAGGDDAHQVIADCFATMLADDNAALGAVVHDRVADGRIYPEYQHYLRQAHARTDKPVFLVSNHQGTGADPMVTTLTEEGFPVLDGLAPFLIGVRCMLSHRDHLQRVTGLPPAIDAGATMKWRQQLRDGVIFSEAKATQLLTDLGLPMNPFQIVDNEESAVAAFHHFGTSVAMKTARADLRHKSDVGGVILDIESDAECVAGYETLSRRFGREVLVAPMINESGIEMILGVINDEQLGPMVMLGLGGIHAEVLRDVQFIMAPFDTSAARRALDKLKMRPLLDGRRGASAVDIHSYCEAAARLSVVAEQFRNEIAEIDINPLIVHAKGCVAVDALIQPRSIQSNNHATK